MTLICTGCEHESLHAMGAEMCSFDEDGTPREGSYATVEAQLVAAAAAREEV